MADIKKPTQIMDEAKDASPAETDFAPDEAMAQLVKVLRRRMSTYSLISRLFRVEVDQPFLDELKAMRFPHSANNAMTDQGYERITKFLSSTWENTLTDLAVDYVRTFVGYGMDSFSAAFPYESVYTSERRLLMQESRDEVLALYRAAGLEKGKDWPESEDHIALELEYMAILTRRAVDSLERGDEDEAFANLVSQANFLDSHLINWAPLMTVDMRKFAKTDLYQGLSYLTEGFLASDREFLAELLDLEGAVVTHNEDSVESES